VQLQVLKSREHKVDASIRDTFRSAMPGEAIPPDPRRRMEMRLQAVRQGDAGMLPALQAIAQASQAAPGTAVQSLNFHSGKLETKLSAPDAAHLDQLSQSLRSSGWQSDLIGGNNTASGYEGRIQLSAGGG
jgi:type II secretory pathway component PulL